MKKWLCFTVLCLAFASVAQSPSENKMRDFAKNYQAADSERKKLLLCLDAIDQKLVYRGGPVASIDQLFGTDYHKRVPAKGQPMETGVVHFATQPPPPPSNDIAAAYIGWYLVFEFDSQGKIQNYYLTDYHK
jgi:hypothetical protein